MAALQQSSVLSVMVWFLLVAVKTRAASSCVVFSPANPPLRNCLLCVDFAVDSSGFGDAIPHFAAAGMEPHALLCVTNIHHSLFVCAGYSGFTLLHCVPSSSVINDLDLQSLLWALRLLLTEFVLTAEWYSSSLSWWMVMLGTANSLQ